MGTKFYNEICNDNGERKVEDMYIKFILNKGEFNLKCVKEVNIENFNIFLVINKHIFKNV